MRQIKSYVRELPLCVKKSHTSGSLDCASKANEFYRSGTVNSKSFVGKVLLRIKRKFELTYPL